MQEEKDLKAVVEKVVKEQIKSWAAQRSGMAWGDKDRRN
jgi:hypothetical protein